MATMKKYGLSCAQRPLTAFCFGDADSVEQLVITASIHGRESINTQLMIRYGLDLPAFEPWLQKSRRSIWVLPLLNPDGVIESKEKHPRCRTNLHGVDLNRNFPCGFSHSPVSGPVPASEPETKAIISFMQSLSHPVAAIHYHSVGSLIYWDYQAEEPLAGKIHALASYAKRLTHYKMVVGHKATAPGGGFGDWCAYSLKIPTITIETGHFFAPVPSFQYPFICRRNLPFLLDLATIFSKGESDAIFNLN